MQETVHFLLLVLEISVLLKWWTTNNVCLWPHI